MAGKLLEIAFVSDCPTQLWGHIHQNNRNDEVTQSSEGGNEMSAEEMKLWREHAKAKLSAVRKQKLSTLRLLQERLESINNCKRAVATAADAELLQAKAVYQGTKLKMALFSASQQQLRDQVLLADWASEAHKSAVRVKQAHHNHEADMKEAFLQLAQQIAWQRYALRLSAEMELRCQAPVYCDHFPGTGDGEDNEQQLHLQPIVNEMMQAEYPDQAFVVKDVIKATVGDGSEQDTVPLLVLKHRQLCKGMPSLAQSMVEWDEQRGQVNSHSLSLGGENILGNVQFGQLLSASAIQWLHPPSYFPDIFQQVAPAELSSEVRQLAVQCSQLHDARVYACLEEWVGNAAFVNDDEQLAVLASYYCGTNSRFTVAEHVRWFHENQPHTRMQVIERCGKHRLQTTTESISDVLRIDAKPSVDSTTAVDRCHLHFFPVSIAHLLATSTAMDLISRLSDEQRREVKRSSYYSTIRPAFLRFYVTCASGLIPSTSTAPLVVPLSQTCMVELVRTYLPRLFAAAGAAGPSSVDLIPCSTQHIGRVDRLASATCVDSIEDATQTQELYAVVTFEPRETDKIRSTAVRYLIHVQLSDGKRELVPEANPTTGVKQATIRPMFCDWTGCMAQLQSRSPRFCPHHLRLRGWADSKAGKQHGWSSSAFAPKRSAASGVEEPVIALGQLARGLVRAQHMKILQDRLSNCTKSGDREDAPASWRRWEQPGAVQRTAHILDWQIKTLSQIADMESSATEMLGELLGEEPTPLSEIVAVLRATRIESGPLLDSSLTPTHDETPANVVDSLVCRLQQEAETLEDEQWRVDQKLRALEQSLRQTISLS